MLNVERLLQLNIACLVILGAMLLGLGHGDIWLPIMASGAVVVSLFVTDILGIFAFNRFVANLAAILAAAYSLSDFFGSGSEEQLFAIASLLIYLQMVLLFQRKSSRLYWQLLVLSLLQVVVAAALYVRVESGLLFLVYMGLALSAMTLTYIYRERRMLLSKAEWVQDERRRLESGDAASSKKGGRQGRLRGTPLAVFNTHHRDPHTVRAILLHSALTGVGAMAFAAIFFYSIPRTDDMWQGPEFDGASQTGLARTIRFNERGLIQEGESVAFRAAVVDGQDEKPLRIETPVYFRGRVLNLYNSDDRGSFWDYVSIQRGSFNTLGKLPENQRALLFPRLRITQDATKQPLVFSIAPAFRTSLTPDSILFDYSTYACYQGKPDEEGKYSELQYEVAIGSVNDGRQAESYPYLNPIDRSYQTPMDPTTRAFLHSRPMEDQPYTRRLTQQIIQDIPENEHRRIAMALLNHLKLSGRYRYTLDYRELEFNEELDSIEDFLQNRRVGHCEYFASALCFMLRHAEIPARLVVGYCCDNFNSLSNRYVVQDKHAHVWVEAYLGPDQITDEMLEDGLASPGGAWLRLDPTPAPFADEEDEDLLQRAGDAFDLAQVLWDDFVFDFNARRQNTSVYESLLGRSSLIDRMVRSESWDEMLKEFSTTMGMEPRQGRVVVQALVALFALFVGAAYWLLLQRRKLRTRRRRGGLWQFLGRVVSIVSPRLGEWLSGPPHTSLEGPRVDFYERLAELFQRQGFRREPGQTQAEFVTAVVKEQQEDERWQELHSVLSQIVDAFYLVRFGQRTLSTERQQQIESWLDELEQKFAEPSSVAQVSG